MKFKRFAKNPLIIIFISSTIILIFVSFAISQQKQSEKTLFKVMNNCWQLPLFNVGHDLNRVSGQNWLGTVAIYFDEDNDLGNGWLYKTQADIDDWGNFDVWLEYFDIQPGHFVTVTDGSTRKELVVTSLAIDEIDMDADTVSGTTKPDAQIRVDGGTPQEPTTRNATADVNGYWIVDFSLPQDGNPTIWDLVPGSVGVASEADFDCDETSVWWRLPLPMFSADPVLNRVHGSEWIYSDIDSIYIDNNDDLSDGYLWSVNVENVVIDEWGNFMVWLEEGINLRVGHFVTVTDGIATKYHVVTSLTVDEIDLVNDTVSGTAEHPNAQIRVDGANPSEPTCRTGTADAEGKWKVDFTIPQTGSPNWDLGPDSNGFASERDDDGDETSVPWPIANEPPVAVCKDMEIPVDENCQVSITAEDVDGGSYDPDDDTIELSVDNIGPFSIGDHWVNLTVTDENDKSDACQAKVTVVDTTSPVPEIVELPDLTGECSVEISSFPTAIDNCAENLVGMTNDPLKYTEQGTYTVTWAYDDGNGNVTTQPQTVIVKDTTAPSIDSISARPNVLWPPNHKMVQVIVSISASDNCDRAPTSRIVTVSSNEPENGLGDGDMAPDWEITGDLKVNLRAERSGMGSGRVYTIIVECKDTFENSTIKSVVVTVPHDKK